MITWEKFHPSCRDGSVTGLACLLIWTDRNFTKGNWSEASCRCPASYNEEALPGWGRGQYWGSLARSGSRASWKDSCAVQKPPRAYNILRWLLRNKSCDEFFSDFYQALEQCHIKFVQKWHNLNDVDIKRSYSRCFRGHKLHPKVTILCTLSLLSLFLSDKNFKNFLKLKRVICTLLLCNKGCWPPRSKKKISLSSLARLREISFDVYVHALVCSRRWRENQAQ